MIGIVDYGSGNIQAIKNIYKRLKIDCDFVKKPSDLSDVTKIILPGVGAFDEAMMQLEKSGMRNALDEMVLGKLIPVLGVCVGMQVMASSSDEGSREGLNWFDARVRLFDKGRILHKPKLPHMGWNSIEVDKGTPLLTGIDNDTGFYFLHSYYFECNDNDDVLAESVYGDKFTCAVNRNNIYGFQFHPEKSHSNGVRLFKNFADL